MSSTDRQNRLLVAEDWKRIYQSYRNADFKSYDFDNLRRTMINYLRQNYPEDFNDYIESKYGIIRWTDKLLNKAGELDFACMEKPKSIHLSREFYPHWNGEEEVNTLEEFFG